MIERIERYFTASDERGSIEGLANFGEWEEINLIRSLAGTIRGNHYHKETIELFLILEGEILVSTCMVGQDNRPGEVTNKYYVKAGDVFLINPMVNHTFQVIMDSRWINLLSKKSDSQNPDIHCLPKNDLK